MKCIGYIRVSTEKQSNDGYSLDAQSAKIQALAMLKGYELLEIISDDESAKNLKRPGVQRVIQMVTDAAVDAVIIMKLDRFTRSVKDLADMVSLFNRRNVALISLSESIDTKTAAGELSMNITTSVSQWERRAIGERTKAALDYKRSIGERLGQRAIRLQSIWQAARDRCDRTVHNRAHEGSERRWCIAADRRCAIERRWPQNPQGDRVALPVCGRYFEVRIRCCGRVTVMSTHDDMTKRASAVLSIASEVL